MGDPVSNTFAALQSAYNTVKSIADLNETHAVKVQLGELQAQIFSAQQSALAAQADQAALARRVDELEQLIAQMETWDAEKQRYQLTDFGAGTFAYAVKAGMENDEPPHRQCAAVSKRTRSLFCNSVRKTRTPKTCTIVRRARPTSGSA